MSRVDSLLYLYDSLSKEKREFVPINEDNVTMYVCGPTVYNRVHIGNARPAVIFDVLFRLLADLYPKVTYARNITDIDDKIIQEASKNKEDIKALSQRYTEAYYEDMKALNNLDPSISPLATEHIIEMIEMIEILIAKGHAYCSEDHVLFSVPSMPDYGKLSGKSLQDLIHGKRVKVAGYKKSPADFILWKPSNTDEPGWESPWGRGRPGWHMECSAMSKKHLGETIDIHAGGQDLIFPHHENEIAQSQCAHDGKVMAHYWMHNGFINIDGEKMSKSLGNFRLVRDLLTQYDGEVLRYALLSSHYRSEQNFHKELLDSAKASLDFLYGSIRNSENIIPKVNRSGGGYNALLDDLNTPVVLSELHRLAKIINTSKEEANSHIQAELMGLADMVGLLKSHPDKWFTEIKSSKDIDERTIKTIIEKRNDAKKAKNFELADDLRDQLLEEGVILEDSRDGTKWRRI